MNNRRVIFDSSRYVVEQNNKRVERSYFVPRNGDIISAIDRAKMSSISLVWDNENNGKNAVFYELTGGILILEPKMPILMGGKYVLGTMELGDNFARIEYDGTTTLTIEDARYFYTLTLDGYADIALGENNGIILIKYAIDGLSHLIVLKKSPDFEELVNITADKIDVNDDSIDAVHYYHDSLGRIKRECYKVKDGKYYRDKCEFEYTYSIVYDKSTTSMLIEDAIVSGDYDYIAMRMSEPQESDMLEHYFTELLGQCYTSLYAECATEDIMAFYVDGPMPRIAKVRIEYDKAHNIVNFDSV